MVLWKDLAIRCLIPAELQNFFIQRPECHAAAVQLQDVTHIKLACTTHFPKLHWIV